MTTRTHPLHFPDYRLFWIARFANVFAMTMVVVVIGWQAYAIARTDYGMSIKEASFQLGMIGLVQFLPLFLCSPFSGLAADRFDRRRLAQLALLIDALAMGALGWASWTGEITLTWLYVGSAVHGLVRGFIGPSMTALAPNLVPREMLPRMYALSSVAWQLASIFGPALSGWLYKYGPEIPYVTGTAFMLIAILALQFMGTVAQERSTHIASPFTRIADGFHYVRHHRMLLGCISLDLFAVLLGGATAMLPAYARDILHVDADGLGWLRAAPAMGASLTALVLARAPIAQNVGIKMLGAVFVYGAATAIFGLSTNMMLSMAMLFVLGAADMISVFIRGALGQLYTPDAMRGRVNAISQVFISASNELGEAESGLLAALVGPVVAVVAGGIGAIIITLLWAQIFPELREARDFEPPAKEVLV